MRRKTTFRAASGQAAVKVIIGLPTELHKQLEERARAIGVSKSEWVRQAVTLKLEIEET